MIKPVRLQLSRAKGFNLQAASLAANGVRAVNVGRPSRFGNPFVVGRDGTRAECVELYRWLASGALCLTCKVEISAQRRARSHVVLALKIGELRGLNLACWCRAAPCHADVLLELANA